VLDGGRENVNSGGTASGLTISNGGVEVLYAGGVESGTTISLGGIVGDYGSSINDTVPSGGELLVFSGAAVSGATLSGGLVEIRSGGIAGQINFSAGGTGGTLQLDDSAHFSGTISGFGVPGDIDLRDISFLGSGTTLGYNDQGTSGTLTVSDGTHTATLNLLGHYVAGNFVAQADGNGGTLITDPPIPDSFMTGSPWGHR
jgi:autotransporter passenger strand-loop-strand repeat protein